MMLAKKLYRSNKDIRVGGVCGGIAEYFEVDSSLIRLTWLLVTGLFGSGIVVYVIAWIIIPQRPNKLNSSEDPTIINIENS